MTKQQLRRLYLIKRTQLTTAECAAFNAALLEQFKQIDLTSVKCLHTFLPIIERNEPDTLLIIAWLKKHHPEIKIVYPKTDAAALKLTSYADDSDLVLEANNWNITEPVKGNIVAPQEIDMVLVPLLAFDSGGYRVGYGKGFYDRLAGCRPDVVIVGLSFFNADAPIEDIDEFDIPLTYCLTPQGIVSF